MKRGLLLLVCLGIALTTATGAFAADRRYKGRPIFHAMMTRRFVVWENLGVFRLRTTTKQASNRFHGAIYAPSGTFDQVRMIRRDRGDFVKLSRDGKWLWFSFVTQKGVDGMNFRTDADSLVCFFYINKRKAAEKQEIFLGRRGVHPMNNPFLLFQRGTGRDAAAEKFKFVEDGDGALIEDVVPDSELEEESQTSD